MKGEVSVGGIWFPHTGYCDDNGTTGWCWKMKGDTGGAGEAGLFLKGEEGFFAEVGYF